MRVCVCAFVRALAPFSFSFAWRAFVYAPRVLHSNFCVWLRGCAFVCVWRATCPCAGQKRRECVSARVCAAITLAASKRTRSACRVAGWRARGGGWARECRVPSSSVMYSEMCGRAQRTAITRMHACTHARTCGRDVGTRRDTPTMQACGGGGRLNA